MIIVEQASATYRPDFYKIATKMVTMGAYVVPVPTGQKACVLPDWQNKATRDLGQIEKWREENQHYNCAIVGKPEVGAAPAGTHGVPRRCGRQWSGSVASTGTSAVRCGVDGYTDARDEWPGSDQLYLPGVAD